MRSPADEADLRLLHLADVLEAVSGELSQLAVRSRALAAERRTGQPWAEVVPAEDRPLIVEQVTAVLTRLGDAGAAFRRTQALALSQDGLSHERIAELYGVTRQRVSTMIAAAQQERPPLRRS